jgi:hypothetical protein
MNILKLKPKKIDPDQKETKYYWDNPDNDEYIGQKTNKQSLPKLPQKDGKHSHDKD